MARRRPQMIPKERNYWARTRLDRRRMLGGVAATGLAAAAAGLAGCSSTSNSKTNGASSAASTAKPASSAAAAQPAIATAAAASRTTTPAALDPTSGKPGGTLVFQTHNYHNATALVSARNTVVTCLAGLVHSGLLAMDFGEPPSNGRDAVPEPDLAQALPEQPDPLTYAFKLRPGIKFQNGRDLTAQDVQYSFDRYAHLDKSAYANNWLWYDSVQTPDPLTVVVKSKNPFADAV